jgi:hypothetical protein
MDNQFSVYWWDADGGQHDELRFVDGEKAVSACRRLTHGPAAMLGIVDRVIITDGGDCTCFEWKKELGLVWPTPEKGEMSS